MRNTTKLFIDFEFTGLYQNTEPISLGIISEDGRYFYAEFIDYNKDKIDDWVRENIVTQLVLSGGRDKYAPKTLEAMNVYGTREEVRKELVNWLEQFDHVTFFGDVPHYDWILFCDLFGGALNIPKNVNYICFDLATLFLANGVNPDIDRRKYLRRNPQQHNALADATTVKLCYEKLTTKQPTIVIISIDYDENGKYIATVLNAHNYRETICGNDPVSDFKTACEMGRDMADYIMLSSTCDEFVEMNSDVYGWYEGVEGDEIYRLAPHERQI